MTSASPPPNSTSEIQVNPVADRPLRWWPVAILVIIMGILKFGFRFVESPSVPLMMASFFGPIWVTLLILVWWLGFSRAKWREKLLAFGGVTLIAIIAILSIHFSLKGMGVMISVLPAAGAAFGLAMIVSSRWRSSTRLPFALAITAATFGYWELIQSAGVTGSFQAQYRWRWEKTSEDLYLTSRVKPDSSSSNPALENAPPTDEPQSLHAEWPSFRGPERDGRAPGIALAENWATQPPRAVWKKRIGPGWSSFVVAGSRLFTQEQRGENEAVVCLDANTGKEVWAYEYPGRFWEAVAGAGPRATPTLAADGLYAFGAQGMLLRLDPRTGKLVWKQDVKSIAKLEPPMWGFSSSPLVTHGMVVVHAGDGKNNGKVLAFDATDGTEKWAAAAGGHSYSSAQLGTFGGVTAVLMLTNTSLQALSPETGKAVWEKECKFENYRALQPLVVDQSVFVATGMGNGTHRVDVLHTDSQWNLRDEWTSRDMKCDFNDFVQHKGMLYGFDGEIFGCIDLETGKRRWKKGRYGKGQVLLLPDADQLIVLSEQGDIILLRATPEKGDEIARSKGIEGKTWNHPVLVGRHLYIRNAEEAACYEMPRAEPPAP